MNTTTKIQIQFSEPEPPLPIRVRYATAVASRLTGVSLGDSNHHRPVAAERFIALIRRALQKRGLHENR